LMVLGFSVPVEGKFWAEPPPPKSTGARLTAAQPSFCRRRRGFLASSGIFRITNLASASANFSGLNGFCRVGNCL
jgi:hypothetical protein